jgi:phosphoribosylformylglycinamidine synthase
VLALLAQPTIADKSAVYRQYDHQLFLNTVVGPGSDAALLRVKGTRRGVALTTDGKARFCALDPRVGARLAVIEGARNLACVGAEPRALVNCLNFGNPEHPEVMWHFAEVTEGLSEACEALDIPVIGGNVSFYNESRGVDIDPSPVVGVVGVVDDLSAVPPPPALAPGSRVVVLGETADELGGSEWATAAGLRGGAPPAADLDAAHALHRLVRGFVRRGAVLGVHDCSDGGLAIALAEMAILGECGARIEFASGLVPAFGWFSESASRVVVSVAPDGVDGVLDAARSARVPAAVIGEAGGDRIVSADFDVAVADATRAWRDAIPRALDEGARQDEGAR